MNRFKAKVHYVKAGRSPIWMMLPLCLTIALTGCSTAHGPKQEVAFQASPSGTQTPGVQRAPAVRAPKRQSQPVQSRPANAPPRGLLLQREAPSQGGGQENSAPESPQAAAAAAVKVWAPIKIETYGIQVAMKSWWKQEQMNVHIAVLGPRDGLDAFFKNSSAFQLQTTDPDGKQLMKFDIRPQDFQWAPPTVNNGIPTLQLDSSVDCPLDPYIESTNWNFVYQ
jgi:hypothetical protein